ncbi:MAG: endonuclease/exonuclease/phosphatase family protein [Bacteroidia bacterium]|nr:endonuclease/exonuclease/phosphatase family protein [Bacteroidia bacterium]
MKFLKKALFIILIPVLAFGLYLVGNVLFAFITDFKPPVSESLELRGMPSKNLPDSVLSLLNWNIGYSGLGQKADFFYDGGTTVISPEADVNSYFQGIKNTILHADSIDFILLQEVDTLAKRSYKINQLTELGNHAKGYGYSFATNYDVKFVPKPFTEPLGKVVAGLMSLTKYFPKEITRYQYPGQFEFPTYLFFLDRCFLLYRYPLKNGKELLVINTHNSAYDNTGEMKKGELNMLKKFVTEEYAKGNYIIIGGDWNQCPPHFDPMKFNHGKTEAPYTPQVQDPSFLPSDWHWVADTTVPSNRNLITAYNAQKTFTTVIDYYLLSPNVEPLAVKTLDMQFAYSDHQPVYLKVKLK